MSFYDILLAKKLGGGGGSSVTVEPLSVSQNGTYSETGKAYSPVSVSVPQPSGSTSISENGTYDVTAFAEAVVNVSGGGGGGPANIVTGTFRGTTDETKEIEVSYSGTGYPIAITIVPLGGPMASIGSQNNNVQAISALKGSNSAPSSSASTKQFTTYYVWSNYGTLEFKNSATIALTYSTSVNSIVGFAFEDATHLLVKFTTAKAAGFVPNVDFYYAITYSA